MSSEPAIEARGLGKAYWLYPTPQHRLRQAVQPRLARGLRRLGLPARERQYFSEHWALRDLSFAVPRGETLAVVGRNGAGKSTLLQLVCGTLTPTTGTVAVRGRVAALLELGSGFNPEYTGRENVLMNATVLGLPREEAMARMNSILAFADIGDLVDQPVKTLSSGMAMRLAFAVIAHVDAEVLIIDEALAVGDAFFQQKCLRWLREFQSRGTVLFCGHDMGAVMTLCERAIWLDGGRLRMEGPAKAVAEAYNLFNASAAMGLAEEAVQLAAPEAAAPPLPADAGWLPAQPASEMGTFRLRVTHLRLLDAATGQPCGIVRGGQALALEVRMRADSALDDLLMGVLLTDRLGQQVVSSSTSSLERPPLRSLPAGGVGWGRMEFRLPHLHPGPYLLTVGIAGGTQASHVQHHWAQDVLRLDVVEPNHLGSIVTLPMAAASLRLADPLAGGGLAGS